MKKVIIYMLLAASVLAVACDKGDEGTKKQEELVPVSIHLGGRSTRAADENSIKRVRVLMFGTDNSVKQNLYFASVSAGKVTFDTYEGTYDMYYIINEPVADKPVYDAISTVEQIQALRLAYSTPAVTPYEPADIPMFQSVAGQQIKNVTDGTNVISVEVVRQMAKVLVDINVDKTKFAADQHVEISSVTLKGLPVYSYVISKTYDGAITTASEIQTKNPTTTENTDTYNFVFYVPEYILTDSSDKNAAIEIKGKVAGLNLDCSWSEPLGDKMGGSSYTNYSIHRNSIYHLVANVVSYGEHDLIVSATVEDWTEIDITDELN